MELSGDVRGCWDNFYEFLLLVGNVLPWVPRTGLVSGKEEIFYQSCRLEYGAQKRV